MPALRFDENGVATFRRLDKEEIATLTAHYEGFIKPVASVTREGEGKVWAEPRAIPVCLTGQRVNIHWDLTGAVAGQSVDIWIRPSDRVNKLWMTTGLRGAAETGPWATPGLEFIFKDHSTNRLVANLVIGGEQCP